MDFNLYNLLREIIIQENNNTKIELEKKVLKEYEIDNNLLRNTFKMNIIKRIFRLQVCQKILERKELSIAGINNKIGNKFSEEGSYLPSFIAKTYYQSMTNQNIDEKYINLFLELDLRQNAIIRNTIKKIIPEKDLYLEKSDYADMLEIVEDKEKIKDILLNKIKLVYR